MRQYPIAMNNANVSRDANRAKLYNATGKTKPRKEFCNGQTNISRSCPSGRKPIRRVAPLKEHLGPILWQLPPNMEKDLPRLDEFLAQLPRAYSYAVEFRHPSWNDEEVLSFLKERKVAFVSVSSMRMPMNLGTTANFVYVRFHGLEPGAAHDYTRAELKPWAAHCRAALRKGLSVYAYFNNDWNVRAPKNAKELIEMITS